MNFEPNERQAQRIAGFRAALADHHAAAGIARDGFDADALSVLRTAVPPEGLSLLDSVLLCEEAARVPCRAPVGMQLLLTTGFAGVDVDEIVAPVRAAAEVPVRYGRHARWLLVIDGQQAALLPAGTATAVASNYIYPLAHVRRADGAPRKVLPAPQAMLRWRLAIAAEIVGTMDGALQQVTAYLSTREQFGVALGSLQAIQHRLAEHAVSLESARWLARDAAWQEEPAAAAAAAALAARAARALCADAHQLCGARGFTHAFGLDRWTLRLQFLGMEAGGAYAHESDAAEMLWGRG